MILTRPVVQPHTPAVHRVHGRLRNQEFEVKALQGSYDAQTKGNGRWQAYVEAIIENLDEGFLIADDQERVTILNHQAEAILGKASSQVLGCFLHRIWKDSGLPPVPFSNYEHRGRILHGRDILVPCGPGGCSTTIRVLHDVTETVDLERRLDARQRAAALGEMVGRVAHEIRNPLGSIELFASLLGSTTQNDPERHRLAEQISTVVRTLDQLLSNFLVISGTPQQRIQRLSVEKLMQDTVMMAMPSIRHRAIVVREFFDPHVSVMEADEILVKQGLLNILLNAIQASPKGGTIELASRYEEARTSVCSTYRSSSSTRNDPVLALSVRDFGVGIAPEDQPRLYDPFFSKRKGGTGLGLAIVQQVMEIHGGWVDCRSQLGKGTTLQLCFPQRRKIE